MGKCKQFIAIFNYYDKRFCEKEFTSTNDTNHSLFTIPVENFALFIGSYFKILPLLWGLFQNATLIMGPCSDFSKAHIYQTP